MLSFFFCDSHHKTAAVRLLSEKKKYKKTSKLFLQILTINVKTIKAIQNLEMPCFILQYLSSSINTISDQLLAYYSTQVYDHLSGQILIKQWWYLRVGMKQSFFFFFCYFSLSITAFVIWFKYHLEAFICCWKAHKWDQERTQSIVSMNMELRRQHHGPRFTVTLDSYRKDRWKHYVPLHYVPLKR